MLFLTVLISCLLSGMCVDGGSVFNPPARLPVWGKTGLSFCCWLLSTVPGFLGSESLFYMTERFALDFAITLSLFVRGLGRESMWE